MLLAQGGVCCVPGCGSTGPFEEEHSTPNTWEPGKPDQLMCIPHHKKKTKRDIAAIAKVKRIVRKRDGLTRPKRAIPSRPFPPAGSRKLPSRPFPKRRD